MPVEVEPVPPTRGDDSLSRCRVTITDATGKTREYDIRLQEHRFEGGYLMGGSRVDDDAPDDPAGGGPTELAWKAAREHFRDIGWEVYEG